MKIIMFSGGRSKSPPIVVLSVSGDSTARLKFSRFGRKMSKVNQKGPAFFDLIWVANCERGCSRSDASEFRSHQLVGRIRQH